MALVLRPRPPRPRGLLVLLLALALLALHHHHAVALGGFDDHDQYAEEVVFDAPGLLGRVRGRRVRLPDGRYGAQLIGLPYANQPVRRFAPATVWDLDLGDLDRNASDDNDDGVWDATGRRPLPPCPQMADGAVVGDEQCLYANVFLPPRALHNASSTPLPVYAFVHGGAFILGSPSSPQLDGLAFAAETDVVVVTLAYRLGALGFMAHPGMAPAGTQGNLGLLDLRVGLEWVQRYIRVFGGDPTRVTLGGQSAGAYLACLLLAMHEEPRTAKSFRGVVLESGGCYAQPLPLAQNRTQAWNAEVGCAFPSSNDSDASAAAAAASLACLRRLPLEALLPASTRRGQEEYHYWQPTVVGADLDPASPLPAQPSELLAAHEALRRSVPVIAGTNEDEGTLFLPPTGLLEDDSDAAYVAWVRAGGMRRGQGFPFLTAEVWEGEGVVACGGVIDLSVLTIPQIPTSNRKLNKSWLSTLRQARARTAGPPRPSSQVRTHGKKRHGGLGQNANNPTPQHHHHKSDAHYKCPTLHLGRLGWRSLHLYRFAYFQRHCDAVAQNNYMRCYHGSELPYIFDHPRQTPCRERAFLSCEEMVADAMRGLWAAFIHNEGRSFDPAKEDEKGEVDGGEMATVSAGRRRALRRRGQQWAEEEGGSDHSWRRTGDAWPAFHEGRAESMLRFQTWNISMVPADRREVCAFWDTTRVYR